MKVIMPKNYTLQEIENWAGVEAEIRIRPTHLSSSLNIEPYYCSMRGLEISEGYILKSACGNGQSINEAVQDFCTQISNQCLVIHAYGKDRQELNVGNVTYPEGE